MSLRCRPRVAALGAVALAVLGTSASAVPVPVLPLPVPLAGDCLSTGPVQRYVVLFASGTSPADAAAEIADACGTTVDYHPAIGVAVASAADPSFGSDIGADRAYSAGGEGLAPGALPVPDPVVSAPARADVHTRGTTARDVVAADRTAEQWDMALIRARAASEVERGDPDVVVGVLDSGVDPDHPDLVDALDRSRSASCLSGRADPAPWAWAPSGTTHGTHVAGTIAAADDGRGITGVAPGVRIASVRVVDDDGYIYPEYAVCGFMWAAEQGMRVTNSSFFVDPWLFTCADAPGQAVAHEAVRRAVSWATRAGVLNVAAVGNEGADLANPVRDDRSPDNARRPQPRPVDDGCDVLPAELPGVVAVAAVGAERVRSGYSSYGRGVVDVAAPGGDVAQDPEVSSSGCVLSTVPGGYAYACGTSMATPHAAGVAALLASTRPRADPAELANLLTRTADPLPCPPRGDDPACTGDGSAFYGRGLVDALTAVTR
ncbi:MAG: S8 family serine peptidase [Actinomycetota bacterium]|nr:S8 family serine peptidase [Actinomycetota bacterium]